MAANSAPPGGTAKLATKTVSFVLLGSTPARYLRRLVVRARLVNLQLEINNIKRFWRPRLLA
jgi:hypothetical protein